MIHSLFSAPSRPTIRSIEKTVIRKGVVTKERVWVDEQGREYIRSSAGKYTLKHGSSAGNTASPGLGYMIVIPGPISQEPVDSVDNGAAACRSSQDSSFTKDAVDFPDPLYPTDVQAYRSATLDMLAIVGLLCIILSLGLMSGYWIGFYRSRDVQARNRSIVQTS
jgi:hypothetical protein